MDDSNNKFVIFGHFKKQAPEIFYSKVFLKILQNSLENTCLGVSFVTKLQLCFFTSLSLSSYFTLAASPRHRKYCDYLLK